MTDLQDIADAQKTLENCYEEYIDAGLGSRAHECQIAIEKLQRIQEEYILVKRESLEKHRNKLAKEGAEKAEIAMLDQLLAEER